MKAKEQSYKTGDIFTFQIAPGEYAFGRVLLDIYNQCFKKGLIDKTSAIYFGNKHTILVEIYKETSSEKKINIQKVQTLIPGIFTSNIDILLNYWEIIDHEKIDPTKVTFPESLSHKGAFKGHFVKGEIRIPVDIAYEEIENLKIYRTEFGSAEFPDLVLYSLGRENEINLDKEKLELRNLKKYDIRFSEYKEKIYALLPDEIKQPYYEMAKNKGFDLMRFY